MLTIITKYIITTEIFYQNQESTSTHTEREKEDTVSVAAMLILIAVINFVDGNHKRFPEDVLSCVCICVCVTTSLPFPDLCLGSPSIPHLPFLHAIIYTTFRKSSHCQ